MRPALNSSCGATARRIASPPRLRRQSEIRQAHAGLGPTAPVRRVDEKRLIAIQRRLVFAGCEEKISLQAAWTKVVVADELSDWDCHAPQQ